MVPKMMYVGQCCIVEESLFLKLECLVSALNSPTHQINNLGKSTECCFFMYKMKLQINTFRLGGSWRC